MAMLSAETGCAGGRVHSGRPSTRDRKDIPAALVEAAKQAILRGGGAEFTATEIAQIAGVDPAMINYYFRSKSGLVSAIIDAALRAIAERLAAIEDRVGRERSIDTAHFLRVITEHYFEIAPIVRILLKEVANCNSETHKRYKDFDSRNFRRIEAVVRACIRYGLYREDLDPRRAALTITCLTAALTCLSPTFINSLPAHDGSDDSQLFFTFEELAGSNWIETTSAMLDREFRKVPPLPA